MMKRLIHHLSLLILCFMSFMAVSEPVKERDMKAALLYNFAVFTTWPESPSFAFNICVFEEDRDNINQQLLTTKKINGKPVSFIVLKRIDALKDCQVLYSEEKKIDILKISTILPNHPVLSVVDATEKPSNKGIINIELVNNKFQFSINNEAAKRSNLSLSSKLLRLAVEVK